MRQKLREGLIKLSLGMLFLGACIELLSRMYGLPNVLTVLSGITILWSEGTLQHDVQVSTARWLIGWLIGSFLGVILGLLTGRIKHVRTALEGLLILLRAVPFISLVPLSLRIFGLAETGKIFLVAWASAGICWVVVHQAAQDIPPHVWWRSKSLGATGRVWIFKVLLPSCREGIYSGLRASLSLGLIVIAVAEMSGVYERSSGYWWSEGIGYRLFRSLDESRDDLLLASILIFALLGIVADQIFVFLWKFYHRLSFFLQQRRVSRLVIRARDIPGQEDSGWQDSKRLDVAGLQAGYNGNTIVRDLTFSIPQGATMSVVGPSGCGKTTLIRAIGHFTDEVFSVSGRVTAGAASINEPGPWIGVVFQDAPVFEYLTVWDNVTFGNRFRTITTDEIIRTAWQALSEFGLESFATQRAGTLSGGQRQRLALAMVLANRPLVLLLDEPFGALDAITRRQLQHFYWQRVHGRVTAVFVTHDLEEALIIGDTVRVGIAPSSKVIKVNKGDLPPHEWELNESFNHLRTDLIAALEDSSAEESNSSQRV
jgi:ABC-type nitrate/sulfonate/bicarbonate transport system ATPase subunit/ABC-type nitrate/sulfonate/bicarbonate transport system permease component